VNHFLKKAKHVDAEDLYRQGPVPRAQDRLSNHYRTLNLLRTAGTCRPAFPFSERTSLCSRSHDPEPIHDHLRLHQAGGRIVRVLENHEIEDLQKKIATERGYFLTFSSTGSLR